MVFFALFSLLLLLSISFLLSFLAFDANVAKANQNQVFVHSWFEYWLIHMKRGEQKMKINKRCVPCCLLLNRIINVGSIRGISSVSQLEKKVMRRRKRQKKNVQRLSTKPNPRRNEMLHVFWIVWTTESTIDVNLNRLQWIDFDENSVRFNECAISLPCDA